MFTGVVMLPFLVLHRLAACGGSDPVAWPVAEAFDVPAPPGSVSLDLGPVRSPSGFTVQPGHRVRLSRRGRVETAEVVDVQTKGDHVTLTVYAPATVTEAWLLGPAPVTLHVRP